MPCLPRVLSLCFHRCPWLHRLLPPPPVEVQQAIAQQHPWLQELQLLRRGMERSEQAQRHGGFCPRALEELLLIADALELDHGWDPLLVDAWLSRIGLWDGEI